MNPPKQIKNYRILQVIGSGSFSTVYKCYRSDLNRTFAAKIIPKTKVEDISSLQREVNAIACISHPNIINLHDYFSDDDFIYLIIDLCQEGDLFQYLEKSGKLDEPEASNIFGQVVGAVQHIHNLGIVHRDLKPENILIEKFPKIRVSDFGLCSFHITDNTLSDVYSGSPCYAGPELFTKKPFCEKKADIWSLGVVLYVMVTGEMPFPTKKMGEMIQSVSLADYKLPDYLSIEVKELIGFMLRADPTKRATIDDVARHQWLKGKVPSLMKTVISIEDFEENAVKTHSRDNLGIISPFDDDYNGPMPLRLMKNLSQPLFKYVK